jgi:hypothetical protein
MNESEGLYGKLGATKNPPWMSFENRTHQETMDF